MSAFASSRMLTAILVVAAIGATIATAYVLNETLADSYNSYINFKAAKLAPEYDYTCGQPVQGLYVVLKNTGAKSVTDLSISITNPICKGAVPPLPDTLASYASLKCYLYSSMTNGTVTISGNNTFLVIKF